MKELLEALSSANSDRREKAVGLVKRGHNFIACLADGSYIFAPSRFAGYKDNNVMEHGYYLYNNCKETDPAVSHILGHMMTDEVGEIRQKLEDAYLDFCDDLDIELKNSEWKYWLLNKDIGGRAGGNSRFELKIGRLPDLDLPTDEMARLTEDQMKRVKNHLRRERNPQVRRAVLKQAKYKISLACNMCGYAHERTPSRIEEAQFEAHHNIPLKEGARDTDLQDISLLCSNCHRLIHRLMTFHKGKVIAPNQAENMLAEEGVNIHR